MSSSLEIRSPVPQHPVIAGAEGVVHVIGGGKTPEIDRETRPIPRSIFFFANGGAAVFDGHGRQMPRYQAGWHGTTIAALAADGIDWRAIPDREGTPMDHPPYWWSAARQARQDAWDAAEAEGKGGERG